MSYSTSKQIGEILLANNKITVEQLNEVLEIQKEKGGRIGWLLYTLNYINRIDLFETLAEHYNYEFKLYPETLQNIDANLLKDIPVDFCVKRHIIPIKNTKDSLTVVTSNPKDYKSMQEDCKKYFSRDDVTIIVVTSKDFIEILNDYYPEHISDDAVNGLFYRNPEESAKFTLTNLQSWLMYGIIIALGIFAFLDITKFLITLFVIAQIGFFTNILYKVVLSLAGINDEKLYISDDEVDALQDKDLPIYSILIPAFDEPAEVLNILSESLQNINYPQNKLDILLLLEEEDLATIEVAKKECNLKNNWQFIVIPDSYPKTKPKACNYGLFFAKGKLLTIYDAEDKPDADQLKKAVIAFKKLPNEYAVLQSYLNYFNPKQNILTKLFTLEYSYWFDYLLPGLNKFDLPIPLGGTSNHFKIDRLKSVGAWDPFNVTEDADLGIRFAAKGYEVGMINSTTYEEANSQYWNWIRQRTRWIKGYLQTFLIHNRHPIKLIKKLGFLNWASVQYFIGGTVILFLLVPFVWALFILAFFTSFGWFELIPDWIVWMALINFAVGNFMTIFLNMLAVYKRKQFGLIPWALLSPLYWLFGHSVAAYRALWQLIRNPHFWEKTNHGLNEETEEE